MSWTTMAMLGIAGLLVVGCDDGGTGTPLRDGALPAEGGPGGDASPSDASSNDGAASPDSGAPPDGSEPDAASGVSYTTDVQPILEAKCSSCHTTGASGGVNHASRYEDTQGSSGHCAGKKVYECMLERIQDGSMPQGRGCSGDPATDSGNSDCLTADEQATVQAWVSAGAPE